VVEPFSARLRWLVEPAQVDPALARQLVGCWRDVSNAGGAVGFPFLPVSDEEVRPAVDSLLASLDPHLDRLLVAEVGEQLAGWLLVAGSTSPLSRHWARVRHVQTSLEHRGKGVGRALMAEAARSAREDLHLRHLRLEVRAGMGLEDFYGHLGWQVAGRWPQALRLADEDLRDEVLMVLPLRQPIPADDDAGPRTHRPRRAGRSEGS